MSSHLHAPNVYRQHCCEEEHLQEEVRHQPDYSKQTELLQHGDQMSAIPTLTIRHIDSDSSNTLGFSASCDARTPHKAQCEKIHSHCLMNTIISNTWIAGTSVKYPMRMMQSSVAMFFMIDQLSLLRPVEEESTNIQS